MNDVPARLAVLISGSGRTLLNLVDRIEEGTLSARIELVIASRECVGAERARNRGLRVIVRPGPLDAEWFGKVLAENNVDWIILAGYLQLAPIPPGYEGRMVNIHPALLPRHGGPGMYGMRVHRAVLRAGDTESGCTVHLCDGQYDTGPIVLQRTCAVEPGDTPETLAARVFALELEALPAALQSLIESESRAAQKVGEDSPGGA